MKSLFSLSTMVLLLSLVAPNLAKATNYYVDPSSVSSSSNGSLAYPWKTISQVNSGTTLLNPGDTVFFKRGQTFSGRLQVSRSGTASAPIVYTNYGVGNLPVFDNAITDIINLYGRQYVVINGFKITDSSISSTDHSIQANISYAINVDNSPNCTIRNCDISLVGVGISVTAGSDNTTIVGNYMHNMRMVRNTPTSVNPDDDYGANPMVIGTSYNTITHNRFEECWASSYDYGFDGGAVELFGSTMNNNKIMYNIAINCNGFMEIGSSSNGVALNNLIAYNKIINCGIIGVYQNGSTFTVTVNGLQYFNNTVIETKKQYSQSSVMFWMAGSGTAGMVTVKNNIFWLSSGVNFTSSKFVSGQMIHTNNIFRMSAGSLGLTLDPSELFSSTLNLFQNASEDPSLWDLSLLSGAPAINFGTNVSLTKDFIGNSITGNPDAGMLEYQSASIVAISPLVASATNTQIKCYGDSAQVTVSATGGTAPYTGVGIYKIVAGNYSYIVSDVNGLKDTVNVSVFQPTKLVASASAGIISVYGGSTSVTVLASAATSPYTYSFNNSIYQNVNQFTNVLAGTYPYAVKDANGCATSSTIQIAQPSQVIVQPLVASAIVGKINCYGGSTTATVSASGGVSPYTGIGTFTITAGLYSFIITDAAGNKDTVTFTLSQPMAIAASVTTGTISTTGGTTSAVINASGGTSPYLFNVDGGAYQSSNTFSNLYAGSHSYNVKDNVGCLFTQSFFLADYVAPTLTTSTSSVRFKVSVYPNPTSNYFTLSIKYHGSAIVNLNVFDMQGNIVYQATGNAYSSFVFGQNFIAGTYYAKVNIGGTIQTIKLLKV